ncbi:DUF4007 family protein [Rhizobium ruizarguesonis]|uniref:DUF4007 family protein n=1 Tax=Rhizobium ruizarguesonis TaxID=2081791 RepID=UPI00102F51E1|nr:DUF4007 family protein [Rhizobium ruizarguesonis]TBD01838.1 DUF4007 family protein [Rhizobium ruizarguesonis]TBD17984.1 DUF4007 family protein [Rhizobium ruizarguesonis]TBE99227.1 DUF4007 family protein [Rhizobium ruizarguesonis]
MVGKTKFEFGRHETFALREGWLDKGLSRIISAGGFKGDLETADALGLGKNMAKSLQFWVEATGLASRGGASEGRFSPLTATSFGRLVSDLDVHFEYSVSTWFVHMILARRPGTAWNWFFNDFRSGVFDRETCVEGLLRHVRDHAVNQTTITVLQREVACMLGTYASLPASEAQDPEDFTISPLRTLGLLVKHTDTGRFEKTAPLDAVPVEAFLACVQWIVSDADTETLPLSDLISRRGSPARLFNIDGDTINELAHAAAEEYGDRGVRLSLLGSTRTITMPRMAAPEWYSLHFRRIGAR